MYRDGGLAGSTTVTAFTDEGLAADQTYVYTVRAVDSSGNWSALSAALDASTLGPDETSPDPPTNLRMSTRTSSSISLAWDAAIDDRAVTGYSVIRDGQEISRPTSLSFVDQGLTGGVS